MNHAKAIRLAHKIVADAGLEEVALDATNFLDFADLVRDILKGWPAKRKATTKWLLPFARTFRVLRDEFDTRVAADPMMLYKPAHSVALEFHQSRARTRYFRASNRCSKTQAGCADNYWVATGQHPWRPHPPLPASVGIVGTSFTKYCPMVFEAKYLDGEAGNPLSPIFPNGGKWFYHYDSRKHIISLACPQCAEAGKAGNCSHAKSYIILFSDNEGPIVLAGGQYSQLQFDEQVDESFLGEGLKRLNTVPNSGLIVTETPLGGKGFWTHKILTTQARSGKTVGDSDRPLCTLHTIDQFSAGLTNADEIRADMEMMSKAEVECRVYGRPAAFSDTGVFHHYTLDQMNEEVREPERGVLIFPAELEGQDSVEVLSTLVPGDTPEFQSDGCSELRIWEHPDPYKQYIIGADVSEGLIDGDASCAQVLAMTMRGYTLHFEQVASLHGWINPEVYALMLIRLAVYYNEGLVVPERNGPGHELIRRMKAIGYWNLFRDESSSAQVEFNVDPKYGIATTPTNKGAMISALQQCVRDRQTQQRTLVIHCEDTLEEMGCYSQSRTEKGMVSFAGISGSHDDRVTGLFVAVHAAKSFACYDFSRELKLKQKAAEAAMGEEERRIWAQIHQEST